MNPKDMPTMPIEYELPTTQSIAFHEKRARRFLKGPIPLDAIAKASNLPGRALAMFLAVHHQAALTGKPDVTLPKALLMLLGIDKDAKARALHVLAEVGLLTVQRNRGRSAKVSLSLEWAKKHS